jgi:hypothetical protein
MPNNQSVKCKPRGVDNKCLTEENYVILRFGILLNCTLQTTLCFYWGKQ